MAPNRTQNLCAVALVWVLVVVSFFIATTLRAQTADDSKLETNQNFLNHGGLA